MSHKTAIRTLPGQALICLLTAVLFALSIAADSSAATQTRRDVTALQGSVAELQQEVSELKEAIKGLPSGETLNLILENHANLTTRVADLLREVQVLTGRFDESRFYLDKLIEDTAEDIDTLKQRVDSVSSGLTKAEAQSLVKKVNSFDADINFLKEKLASIEQSLAKTGPPAAAGKPENAFEGPPAKAEPTPENVYESALNVYKEKKYAESRAMMEAFIDKYPTHTLAGNAQFWVAETYYAEKDYDDAILSYEDLLQKYKDHGKVPSALLKQAFAFMELGDKKAARGILRELIEKYPGSEQTTLAKEKLATIEAQDKPGGKK